jgi:4-amino-4-deoxy-L-arabinose transferase-like glycosyltransferase
MGPNVVLNSSTTAQGGSGAFGRLARFAVAHRVALACVIIIFSLLPLCWFITQASARNTFGDLSHYQAVARDSFAGKLPYRDTLLEYPPYALPIFLIAWPLGGDRGYPVVFMAIVVVLDALMKVLLAAIGFRFSRTLRCFLPVVGYSLVVPLMHYQYLQVYDIWPAMIVIAGVLLFSFGHDAAAGAAVAIGIGVKLYPAVFVPPLFVMAVKRRKGKRFLYGLAAGLFPIVALSFFLPWWRFAAFQGRRGFQVESLYASILWMAKLLHLAQLKWVSVHAWFEVKGPIASACLEPSRVLFAVVVLASMGFASWVAARISVFDAARMPNWDSQTTHLPVLCSLLLIPLLAFIAFNQVLSPQYLIWALPIAAIAMFDRDPLIALAIAVAASLTPVWGRPNYYTDAGINLAQTAALLARNLLLVGAWAGLIRGFLVRICGAQKIQTTPSL